MNKTKTLTTLLLLLATLTAQAQENKGAQRMHKAMVEFVCKFSDPRSACLASITAPEELLPDRKQHVVKVAKRKLLTFPENHLYVNSENRAGASPVWAATQYMQGWAGQIDAGQLEPSDPFPLRDILRAFDASVGQCTSCYTYTVGKGNQSAFPGVIVEYGPHGGNQHDCRFTERDNVRLISFTDADGFRSTYLLIWQVEPDDDSAANIDYGNLKRHGGELLFHRLSFTLGWFHCPASQQSTIHPLMDDYDREYFFGKSNPLGTTDKGIVINSGEVQLDNLNIQGQQHRAYNTLLAKVRRMEQLAQNANANEKLAISLTLDKVCREYTALLSPWQLDELSQPIGRIIAQLQARPEDQLSSNAIAILQSKLNRTPDMASLRDQDQAYLNAMGFHLLRHDVCWDHVTYDGQYYTGDEIVKYLDTYDSECEQKYHAEKVVTGLEPGTYTLTVAVRASGPGAFIYALGDHDRKYLAEIPACYTEGGSIWADACKRIKQLEDEGRGDEVTGYDRRLARANGGRGFGWSRLTISGIEVRDGTLKFGVSTLPEFTGKQLRATWFSACDFEYKK